MEASDQIYIRQEGAEVGTENLTVSTTDRDEDQISSLDSMMNNLQEIRIEVEIFKLGFITRCGGELKPFESVKLTSLFNCINEAINHLKYFIDKSKDLNDANKDLNEVKSSKSKAYSAPSFNLIHEDLLKVELKEDHVKPEYEGHDDEEDAGYDDNGYDGVKKEVSDSVKNIKDENTSEDPLDTRPIKSEPRTFSSEGNFLTEVDYSWMKNSDGPYHCPNCTRVFDDYAAFKRHHKRQHEDDIEIVSCQICEKKMQKKSLKQHLMQHNVPSFQCYGCPKKFVTEAIMLRHHKLSHENYRPLKCNICGKGFRGPRALEIHSVVHTGEKPYSCDQCGNAYTQRSHLRTHIRKIHEGIKVVPAVPPGEKPYTCDQCGKSYTQKSHLRAHIRKIHEGIKMKKYERSKVMCGECGKMLPSPRKLEIHIMKNHEGVKVEKIKYEKKKVDEKEQFVCGECGKMFSRSGFYSHMRHVHEGIERIKYDKSQLLMPCGKCGKLISKHRLKDHEKLHTTNSVEERKTINCPSCTTSFTCKSNLRRHIKSVHQGIKPHSCEVCEKKFASKNEVKEHMSMHTGEKAYKCEDCGKSFSQLSSLYGHRKKSHMEKESNLDVVQN